MYGFNHLPPIQNAISVTEFSEASTTVTSAILWKTYNVPSSATFLYVTLIGGGGDGRTPTVGAATTGGGGGCSGTITKALLPVYLLPNKLYVRTGRAGDGAGAITYLSTENATGGQTVILSAANGGESTSGTGGVAGSAFAAATGRWSGTLALWVSQAGAAGGPGSTTNGVAVTALETLPLTGGGGGGGSSAGTGGNVTGAGPFPTITGGASGENPGRAGMMLRQPFGGVGGSGGGGSSGAGTGANFGGPGAIGCGGGGGGNAASGTPGAGGKGGPGYCLIVAF